MAATPQALARALAHAFTDTQTVPGFISLPYAQMSSPFPPEILCEISLHLPHTEDVMALSLTSHAVRAALSTPALFKARLLLQNWDLDPWQDEDDQARSSGDWKRWMRIDYIHSKTLQLLEEGFPHGQSLLSSELPFYPPDIRVTRFGKAVTVDWCRKLSNVFPMLITHHRVNNIPLITETKYCDVLQTYLTMVIELYNRCLPPPRDELSRENRDKLSTFSWLERACFGLVAFVMQCTTNTIESVFGDPQTTNKYLDCVDGQLSYLAHRYRMFHGIISASTHRDDIIGTSICYSAGFLIQVKISLKLHSNARGDLQRSLLPPSLPPMDIASSYDEPDELGSTTFLRPWLQDRLAGTPLAGLSFTSGRTWAGYHTIGPDQLHDPPMFFELYLAPPPSTDEAACKVYFRGEGADGVGPFTLLGEADTETGVVNAKKTYLGAQPWKWRGVVTPFGMVGTRDIGRLLGWWWIWPQEWSERVPAPAKTVTQ